MVCEFERVMNSGLTDRLFQNMPLTASSGFAIHIAVGLYPDARERLPGHLIAEIVGDAPIIGISPKAPFRLYGPSPLIEHSEGDLWGVGSSVIAEEVLGPHRVLTLDTIADVARAAQRVIADSLEPYFRTHHRPPTADMIASQIIQDVVRALPLTEVPRTR